MHGATPPLTHKPSWHAPKQHYLYITFMIWDTILAFVRVDWEKVPGTSVRKTEYETEFKTEAKSLTPLK